MKNFHYIVYLSSMPFIYSKTKSEIVKLKDGPMQADGECPADQGDVKPSDICTGNGGEYCMGETFLEIGWSKCDNKLHALVHPGLINRFPNVF